MDDWVERRQRMVVDQLEARGIRHPGVLAAMRKVPRHAFVPAARQAMAYFNRALPIGKGQTISQPYMVARMTELLAGDAPLGRVLEIGTGSGYQAAVLSLLAREVISIERRPDLAREARERLGALGFENVQVIDGDGTAGVPADTARSAAGDRTSTHGCDDAGGPWDGILVTAGAPHVPVALKAQLFEGARLVIPVGSAVEQELIVLRRRGTHFEQRSGGRCVFVPLVGQDGWPDT